MRTITMRTILPGMICALCAATFMFSTAAEPRTDEKDVLSIVRSRDKIAVHSDALSVPVAVPLPGTSIDSVLVSVNGEPITLLDVILETSGRERELAGTYSGERLLS